MKKLLLILFALLTSVANINAQVTMNIDPNNSGAKISDYQYGLFFEEINHAGDGGLYAELIRNRSFEDNTTADYWSAVTNNGSSSTVSIITDNLLNSAQSKALKVVTLGTSATAYAGVANAGFWGMKFVKDSTYTLTFWAKSDGSSFKNNLVAQLQSSDGNAVCGEAVVNGELTSSWTKFTATIKASSTTSAGRFALLANADGTFYLDVVSLFPYTYMNRPNGCREDLAQLLADTHPKFLRFPGGCYVEGTTSYANAFQWKKTIGPIENRPGHLNVNWNYRVSDGMGFDEFLQLCEDVKAAPLYVVNVGLGHGYQISLTNTDTLVQNALDAIQYANGDTTTTYGKLRKANGHPEPYNIKFVEIGNENYQASANQQSQDYATRYYKFYKALKAAYPDITLIGNVEAWGTDNPSWRNTYPVECVDEHYYRSYSWFKNNYNKYDKKARGIDVYNGEYAANESGTYGKNGTVNSALGEAIYMLGMEKNSDICKMASFAPIFTNENDRKWNYDMIHFNASQVFCTPSYYVQKLMPEYLGTQNLKWTETGNIKGADEGCKIGVGSWSTLVKYDDVSVTDGDGNSIVADDFSGDDSGWTNGTGTWSVSDGVLNQSLVSESCTSLNKTTVAPSHYIYTVKACKNSGNEGFLVIFNYKDTDNYCWWNVGGWSNADYGVEQCVDGTKTTIAKAAGSITAGKWYTIKIDVDGNDVNCYLDGSLIHSFTLMQNQNIYQSVTIDRDNGVMYLKVVNPHSNNTALKLNVKNMKIDSGSVVSLKGNSGTDENTIDNPTAIVPTGETALTDLSSLDIQPYSLNIYKFNVSNVTDTTAAYVDVNSDDDKYGYLFAHMNGAGEYTNYALSTDGTTFNDILNGAAVFTTANYTTTGGMRDCYITRTQSGKFLLAGTDMKSSLGWTSNHIMDFMLTSDLINWDKELKVDLESAANLAALGVTDVTAAWAPQIIYDPVTKKYVVYYSVGFSDRHRIYYSLMNEDLTEFTAPKLLFDPGYDVIDADIVYNAADAQYVMTYKYEGVCSLHQATAKTLVPTDVTTGTCQWTINTAFAISESGKKLEAPSVFRPIGSDKWKIGFINYTDKLYRLMDLDEHCASPSNITTIQGSLSPQHGSYVKLTKEEYLLLQNWSNLTLMLPSAVSLQSVINTPAFTAAVKQAQKALACTDGISAESAAMTSAYNNLNTLITAYQEGEMAKAEKGDSANLTFKIANSDFSNVGNGWSGTSFTQTASGVAEQYNKTYDFYQTLTGMPTGDYKLSVQSFYRAGAIATAYSAHTAGTESLNATLYMNDVSSSIMSIFAETDNYTYSPYTYPDNVSSANAAFNTNNDYVNTLSCRVTDGTIKLGIRSTSVISKDWTCFDNFKLMYVGNSTGITEVNKESGAQSEVIYDITGRRLNTIPSKGIYIVNGKKILK